MKVMCDTNVILDVLLEREHFVDDSSKVLKLCADQQLEGYISASSVTDIYYLVRKHTHSNELSYKAIRRILDIINICSVTSSDIYAAFQRNAKDFEDCLLATCAKSIHCDYIITRNEKDFRDFGIPIFTPSELLNYLSSL